MENFLELLQLKMVNLMENYENGKLKIKENYVNGKSEGVSKVFYPNGKVKYETPCELLTTNTLRVLEPRVF